MKYKIDDTVKSLKDYTVGTEIVKKGSVGRIGDTDETSDGTVLVKFCDVVSPTYDLIEFAPSKVKIEDLEFMERVDEERGVCPICDSGNLEYETNVDSEADTFYLKKALRIYYPWRCEDCGAYGEEYYSIKYMNTVVSGIE
jgi:hypothetical protein